ncbi:MAG: hypothetical protein EHM42_12550 [Planctomycetaceae bacterium]|nr:MAG: hypothetical protein EHM42_12550 [Planctomycetaceae bacterium]
MSAEYTIRRQLFAVLHTNFFLEDAQGKQIGYCRQKAFKLKEDIRIFTDESMQDERIAIKARNIIDFGAAYDVHDSRTNKKLGALKRKGWASMLRDTWIVMDEYDNEVGKIEEDSPTMALLRRFLSNLIPQSFHLVDDSGEELAKFQQNFNPFLYRLKVTVEDDCHLPAMLVLSAGLLLAAVEGRQK